MQNIFLRYIDVIYGCTATIKCNGRAVYRGVKIDVGAAMFCHGWIRWFCCFISFRSDAGMFFADYSF